MIQFDGSTVAPEAMGAGQARWPATSDGSPTVGHHQILGGRIAEVNFWYDFTRKK